MFTGIRPRRLFPGACTSEPSYARPDALRPERALSYSPRPMIDKHPVSKPPHLHGAMPIARSSTLSDGTYFICAQTQHTCLTLTDANEGTTLTTWSSNINNAEYAEQQVIVQLRRFAPRLKPHSQWQVVTDAASGTATVKNVQHSNFAAYSIAETGGTQYVFANQTSYSWYVEGSAGAYMRVFRNDRSNLPRGL